ncbi:MAG TPA: hypothetical protein DHW42_02290, partial [Candidatus Marinimicrobia bacterium]|nr:hypothetical protein [Candidatus Neomarinimicrobiota bacterium]
RVARGTDFTAEILKAIKKNEDDSVKLQKLIEDIDMELTSPQAKREIIELSESEQKEALEKAKWLLLDQLIKDEA